jgi:hypothetical protein
MQIVTNDKIKDLVVGGIRVGDVDFSTFSTSDAINQWVDDFWTVLDATYSTSETSHIECMNDIFGQGFDEKRQIIYDVMSKKEEISADLAKPVTVDGVSYKKIKLFNILHLGWESDYKAWVVDTPEGNKLVLTDHGSPYFATKEKLEEYVSSYQKVIQDTQDAISLLV